MAGSELDSDERDTYELLDAQAGFKSKDTVPSQHSILSFLRSQPATTACLVGGTAGSGACFGYTYWLSRQVFECPVWALECTISRNVRLFSDHLNEVQGVLGAVFSLAVAMMIFGVYQLAETTIWPVLATRTSTLEDIDQYLAATRGSLYSAPFALANARGVGHAVVLLIVALLGGLQLANSIIVGHAYSLGSRSTTLYSNHSAGGGVGFIFKQGGEFPVAVGSSMSTYNSWAFELSLEPMPDHRQFLIDRANLTAVGDFSAKAVEAHTSINCSKSRIEIVQKYTNTFAVNTSQLSRVLLRRQPALTVWVDRFVNTSTTSAVTTVMFAVMNGTIEGGHESGPDMGFTKVSSLACDVSITLEDSTVCTYQDRALCRPETTLSGLDVVRSRSAPSDLAVYMAAGVSIFGSRINNAQPMYQHHSTLVSGPLTNSSLLAHLPVPFTSIVYNRSPHFDQDALKNFISVGAGAVAMSFMQAWPSINVTLESTLPMQRMVPGRTWILLMPPSLVLGTFVIMALLSAYMYRSANVQNVRLGTTSEVVISAQTQDISAVVHEARSSSVGSTERLSQLRVRYGIVAEGYDGLARKENVVAFTSRKVESLRSRANGVESS